jgi:hypothetical protein
MAFTVGWPDGNSAVSVEYADAHFSDRGVTAWTGAQAVKEGALVRATDYVKALFATRFDPDLFLLDEDDLIIVPDVMARAVAEYALIELVTPGGLAPVPAVDSSGYAVVMTKKKVGPIEKDFQPVAGSPRLTRRIFPVPDGLIAQLLLPSVGLSRTTR